MLQIRLLGQFDVRLDGKRVTISSRAGQSLLAYLALTAGTPHRREKLAGILWPDSSEETARKNLRQELWRIRKALAGQNQVTDYLLPAELTIAFNRNADYWLDATQLERPDLDTQSLSANVALYQGELLPGFFDDWVVLEREHIQSIFETKMEQLLSQLLTQERWAAVQEQSERWLALGNTPEPAYRALMLAHGARGDIAKVSAVYQRCITDLDEKLGLEPSPETRSLYDGLLRGTHTQARTTIQQAGTITFLFTDIEGSTNLLDELGDQYASALADHHKIIRAAVQKWNGHEVDTQGDAFFVTFSRASDAIQCAAEAQRTLSTHRWAQGKPLRVRMGLHTGEPLISSTGYIGMDVHRAARIGDAAHGGQVLLSHTTRELILHDLPRGLSIRDLGEFRLKNMKFPTPIYQLVVDGLVHDFPPLRTKFSGAEPPTPGEPPFKGLQYFDQQDSHLFFGREVLTAKLVKRLNESHFLSVIVGASGSGKSSVVRAGVIPALKKGATLIDGSMPPADSQTWRMHVLTPTAHPLEALATELTRDSESVTATATLMDDLMQDPRSLGLYLARQEPERHSLLVLDQFEELFTLCRDEFEREAFVDNLLNTIKQDRARITLIITLRADFYAHLAQYPELRDAVAHLQEYIGPMTIDELRLAIEEPASRGHWAFEPGLVDLILRDVGDEPGALPLLSHALLETWKRRAGHTLTLKGYADAGGVRGAISHTAESMYQALNAKEQPIARNIFLRLTELGEGTEDTRRRASFTELISEEENAVEVRAVLNQLADARLITLGEDTAEVAHEALIREWSTLREWLNQDREGLRLHRHLTEATYEWELLGRDPGALYRGAHLSQAREWAALHPTALNTGEHSFLEASIGQEQLEKQEREEQHQRELAAAKELAETQRQSAARLRIRNRVITAVGSIALLLALLAGTFGYQSNRNARQAEANFANAEAQRLAAVANNLLQEGGNPEVIALLSVRSMNTQYTPQGDGAIVAAAQLNLPRQLFISHSTGEVKVAYSANDKYVLTTDADNIVRLWDVQTGQEIRQFIGHTKIIYDITFSPDGKFVATASEDQTARLWDVSTGEEIHQFAGEVNSVAYSSDGTVVLTSGFASAARLWDPITGRELHQIIGTQDLAIYDSTFSPDGQFVLTSDAGGVVRLWDIETGQQIRQFIGHEAGVFVAKFSPDGKYVLTGSHDSTARLWDVLSGEELQKFTGHMNSISDVEFSADGKYLFTSSIDGTGRLWERQTGEELQRFTFPKGFVSSAIAPDGKSILTGSEDGIARLWNIQPSTELPMLLTGSGINAVAFSPDGRYILTGDSNGIARLWDPLSGNIVRELIGHTNIINYGAVFSPDGKYILTGAWDATIRLWDIQTGQQLRQFTNPNPIVNSVAFSPDGKQFAAATGGVIIWDLETGQEIRRLSNIAEVSRVAYSADGRYLVTASLTNDGTARLWEASTGQLIRRFSSGLNGNMNSAVFSPDGKYILTASADAMARLLDVHSGEEVRQFIGHTAGLWTASFSPDGRYVVTASVDGTARLWDAETGQELRRLIGHSAGVENVVFSPDGKYILTGSDDGTARLWDVDYHTTMEYLCSRLLRDFTEEERVQYGITDNAPTCP